MVTPAAGAVVLIPFPFSNLAQAKLRPAVVLDDVGRGDWILCQVTSNPYADPQAVELTAGSFAQGSLRITRSSLVFDVGAANIPSIRGGLTYYRTAQIDTQNATNS